MAWDSTCAECTYIEPLCGVRGIFPCTNRKSGVDQVRADRPKCDYFCAIGVGKRTSKEVKDLEDISKSYGRFHIVTAITEILNLQNRRTYNAFQYIREVYMPSNEDYESFLAEYDTKGFDVAEMLRNDEKSYEVASYFYDKYLIEFTTLVEMEDPEAASILYLEMYDKILEHYNMKVLVLDQQQRN